MQSASRNEKGTTMTLTEIFQGALLCCDQNRGNYICFLLLSDIFHSISSTHSLIIIDEYLVVKSRNVNIGLMEIRGREEEICSKINSKITNQSTSFDGFGIECLMGLMMSI